MNIELFSTLPPNEQVGALREWLFSEDQDLSPESFFSNGRALWMIFIELQLWDCVAELLKFKEIDISIDFKDQVGRGFCHYCIYNAAPDFLSIEGLKILNYTWNSADQFGNTPMASRPSVAVGQQMARKWWSENPQMPPKQKCHYFQNLADQISDNDMFARPLKRTWLFWARGSNLI